MKPRTSLPLATLIVAAAAAGPLMAETLEVGVQGVRSSKGTVRADLYAPGKRHIAKQLAPAAAGDMRVRFQNLAPGPYAVLLYHDENANGRLDRGGPLGLPTEGYGFSRDARARLGPPSFDAMRVTVAPGADATTSAKIRY